MPVSSVRSLRRQYAPGVRFDRAGLWLVMVMLAIQASALTLAREFEWRPPDASTQPPPEIGLLILVKLVVVSLLLVGAYRGWKRLSERWQTRLVGGMWGLGILLAVVFMGLLATGVALLAAVTVSWLVHRFDPGPYSWLGHNLVAFGIAVAAVAFMAVVLPPAALTIFLVGALVWDYIAVVKTGWMLEIVELSGGSLPNYFIVPAGWRIDYGAVTEWLGDPGGEPPRNVAGIIGAGDFVLPSALVLSLAHRDGVTAATTVAAAIGVVLAVGVLRAAMARVDGGLPALPWVNTGAIGGWAIGAAAVALLEVVVVA